MVVPIFWPSIWENIPDKTRYQRCLQRIMVFVLGREMVFDEALIASKYTATHFVSAFCVPFDDKHKARFDRGAETAIRFKWDLHAKTADRFTVLNFAIAISAKAAQQLINNGVHVMMSLAARAKALVLAAHYGPDDVVKSLVKNQDSEFVNRTNTLEGFETLPSPALPRSIKEITIALYVAVFHGRRDMISFLVSQGANIDMKVDRVATSNRAYISQRPIKMAATPLVVAAEAGRRI
ncbi:hypothetical protein TWF718_009369 [Orbilia javanica]|uniref:Ankyrin repeat protein n=1 Tax=Orbilia javanica TaxID=47235 RepID=A0AAN8RCJ5_9PEZI